MIYRHTQDEIKEYYLNSGLNQSTLKVLIKDGVQKMQEQRMELEIGDELYYEEKKHFIIGSAVDCYFTNGEEVYNAQYYESKLIKKPSDTIMSIVKQVFDASYGVYLINNSESENPQPYDALLDDIDLDETLAEAITNHNYYSNWKLDTKLNKVREEGRAYWEELKNSIGMQILSEEESLTINSIITSVKTHPFTSKFFIDSEDIDIIFQLPILFEYKDLDCKSLLDIVIVNHRFKTIRIVDIKTLFDYVINFGKQCKYRRYDFQGAFYTIAMKLKGKEIIGNILNKDVSDYTIMPFTFIAQSTNYISTPLVFELSDSALNNGMIGNKEEKLLGVEQALDIYKYWQSHDFDIYNAFREFDGIGVIDGDYNLITN